MNDVMVAGCNKWLVAGCKLQYCGHAIRQQLAVCSDTTNILYLDSRGRNNADLGTNGMDKYRKNIDYDCKLQDESTPMLQAATLGVRQ